MFSPSQALAYWFLAVTWLLVNVRLWAWWLQPGHWGAAWLFLPLNVALFYESVILPSFYWFFVGKMRRPVPVPPPPDVSVAVITLCVPGQESMAHIRAQLEALVAITYPHDSWVLDEGGDDRIRELAEVVGVKYFTRHGRPEYNEPHPPFQAATKAGNVNAWLDYVDWGADYDVFVQFDIDHRPRPDYLDRVLGYFEDPRVGWVQAPSIYGNFDRWPARGAAEQELVLQGPLQMGFYGHSGTPFIIGSHCSYRTDAIVEIGGFQPTRAEDHLDTVVLAAHRYRGVFVPEPIAVGDGPETFETYVAQQFAWAHSMIQVFLRYTPRLFRRYTRRQKLQFLMAQSWYLCWSSALAVMFLLPLVSLVADRPIARVSLFNFLNHYLPVVATSSLMWWWSRKWFHPGGVGITWRGVVLQVARWPAVLWAFVNVVLRVKKPYMITRKGMDEDTSFRLVAHVPYLGLFGLSMAAMWIFEVRTGRSSAQGYHLFALVNGVMMAGLFIVVAGLEVARLRPRMGRRAAVRARAKPVVISAGLVAVLAASGAMASGPIGEALRWKEGQAAIGVDPPAEGGPTGTATPDVGSTTVPEPGRPAPANKGIRLVLALAGALLILIGGGIGFLSGRPRGVGSSEVDLRTTEIDLRTTEIDLRKP